MPSKADLVRQEHSRQRLQALADPPLAVRYRTDLARRGFTVEKVLKQDEGMSVTMILCGPARYEVVYSFLLGVRWGVVSNRSESSRLPPTT